MQQLSSLCVVFRSLTRKLLLPFHLLPKPHPKLLHSAVVPSLGMPGKMNNGSVAIYGPKDELLSTIYVAEKIGHLGNQHPHDAMFLPNGDIVCCCWGGPANTDPVQGPAKGTISYWKRVGGEGGYGGLGLSGISANGY